MDVVVALEYRFDRTPDGAVWTQTAYAYRFWQRYLDVFDAVYVVARVQNVERVPGDWQRCDGPNVTFSPVPHYLGPVQYLQRCRAVKRAVRGTIGEADAVILRVPSQIAATLMSRLRVTRRPYGVEVVGNPRDAFAPGAVRHPLRPLFRWWFARQLRDQCAGAAAAAYVTKEALQRAYPNPSFSVGVSDVEITDASLVARPRDVVAKSSWDLVTVTSLAQLYKGPDVLIDATAECVRSGLDVRLAIAGDGKHRAELEQRAAAAGVADRVRFLGQVPAGDAVRAELDRADVFVLPSRTEGLPRAMIEAMARGLPCIGTNVGGIPELLPPADMVPAGDAAAVASKIREVVTNPKRMATMSQRNFHAAHEYREETLRERRITFYRQVRESTERWLARQHAGRRREVVTA